MDDIIQALLTGKLIEVNLTINKTPATLHGVVRNGYLHGCLMTDQVPTPYRNLGVSENQVAEWITKAFENTNPELISTL